MNGFRAFARHVNPALARFLELSARDMRFVRADGCVLETDDGRRFDDWVAGFGAFNLGHRPAAILDVLRTHADVEAPGLYVEALNPFAGALAEKLVNLLGDPFETVFFSNSGSEAVEAALKTAIAATGRRRIVYAAGGWHGTTLGALSCMAKGLYRAPFDEVLLPFTEVPWDDLAALERALAPGDVAAVLWEPVQMESGVRPMSSSSLTAVRALCDRFGTLLLLDEVQTGLGRTGSFCAFQQLGVVPDMIMLAKSLGGGVVPIGATVMARDLWSRAYGSYLRSEIHHSTFGGNSLACRAASVALDHLADPAFLAGVRATADGLFARLHAALAGSPSVLSIRHLGLLGGIELAQPQHPLLTWSGMGLDELRDHPSAGPLLLERLQRRGIFAHVCGHAWNTLRVEPPLVVDQARCDHFVDAVASAVAWLDEHA